MIFAYVCDYMSYVWEFRDEIILRGGGNVKLEKNQIFLRKGKAVIFRYSTG